MELDGDQLASETGRRIVNVVPLPTLERTLNRPA